MSSSDRSVARGDQVGGLLADDDDGGVSMSPNDGGHHRRVSDPEAVYTTDFQLRIDDTAFVAAHPRRAHRVVKRVRTAFEGALEGLVVKTAAVQRTGNRSHDVLQRRRLSDRRSHPQTRHHRLAVDTVRIGQITRVDDRLG